MRILINNCRCSEPSVYPKNWQTCGKIALKEAWYIKYRFYDDTRGQSKQVVIKGFNRYSNLKDRRVSLQAELNMLNLALEKGFNPFTGNTMEPLVVDENAISKYMTFAKALKFADSQQILAESTRESVNRYFLPRIIKIAEELYLSEERICNIGLKNIRQLLDKLAIKNNGEFSGDQFNRYRKLLDSYYKELIQHEVVDASIPGAVKRAKGSIKSIRPTLTADQRKEIDAYLKENYPRFWLYLHCFFHSGARTSEMFRLKISDVDLQEQRIKFLIKKGNQYREAYRVIPDVAVKYWQEAIADAPEYYYIFSRRLKPGAKPVKPFQITKRWSRLVKQRVGFEADFYSLKHSKATEIIESRGLDAAALQLAESKQTINRHYDVRAVERRDQYLKESATEFADTKKPA